MGRNYQHKHGSELFSGGRPQPEWLLAGSIAKIHPTDDKVVAAVYASISNINDGFPRRTF